MRSKSRQQLVVFTYGQPSADSTVSAMAHWWTRAESIASELGLVPTEVYGMFKAQPRGLVDGKGYSLDRYRTRFADQLDSGNLLRLGLDRVTRPGGYHTFDWDFIAECGKSSDVEGLSFLGVDLALARFRDSESCYSPEAFAHTGVDIGWACSPAGAGRCRPR